MKISNNIVTPNNGNKLGVTYLNNFYDEISLGRNKYFVDGKIKLLNISLNDIYEVTTIEIDKVKYSVKLANNYAQMVTNLIRLKYTLDDELALIANNRLGDNSKENEFQSWRLKCKTLAKELISNE